MKWAGRSVGFFIFGWIAKIMATLWLSTCRLTIYGRELERRCLELNPDKGLLYATWHRGLILSLFYGRGRKLAVIASQSGDGELAAQAAKRFGWIPVRGSSTRGGRQALRQMAGLIAQGRHGGVVVDAPTGPPYISKKGIIFLAQKTGSPILPVMLNAQRAWRLRSWDRTIIPKPFSRIVALFADEALRVPCDASREDLERYRQQLDATLNKLTYQVDHFFDNPAVIDPRDIVVPDPIPLPGE